MSQGEVESPILHSDQHDQAGNNVHNTDVMPQLGRQSSIYSLTLDEFQSTLNESGKNFGSMNMDEFLNSIWTAEENQVQPPAMAASCGGGSGKLLTSVEPNMIGRQLSLARQGSLTLPGSLSRKTVDEVWSEIRKTRNDCNEPSIGNDDQIPNAAQRQPSYGEMTLEDFLVNAGVVREQSHHNAALLVQQQVQPPFGYDLNGSNRVVGPPPGSAHMVRPMMGIGTGGGTNVMQLYSGLSGYPGGKRSGSYQPYPPSCYPGIVGNGSPASPVSSDGIATSQLDGGNQYGRDMGGVRGSRNRIFDGPVEKVVERRHRRMIKNRESAARSRARKQAYTVELEAELNILKEENAQLKQTLEEIEIKRKQQFFEEKRLKAVVPNGKKVKDYKSRVIRRTSSCTN